MELCWFIRALWLRPALRQGGSSSGNLAPDRMWRNPGGAAQHAKVRKLLSDEHFSAHRSRLGFDEKVQGERRIERPARSGPKMPRASRMSPSWRLGTSGSGSSHRLGSKSTTLERRFIDEVVGRHNARRRKSIESRFILDGYDHVIRSTSSGIEIDVVTRSRPR